MAQPRPSAGRHRVRLGHGALANFLRAVAEACSPQRFREENALVRFISLSLAWRHVYICIRLYHGECDFSNPARGPTDLPE